MTAADLLGLLFLARDVTHSARLQTRSFAQHEALRAFYHGIIPLADDFAETYQGRGVMIGPVNLAKPEKSTEIVQFLEQQLKIVESNRNSVAANEDRPVQSKIDAICGLYLGTIHRLRSLT